RMAGAIRNDRRDEFHREPGRTDLPERPRSFDRTRGAFAWVVRPRSILVAGATLIGRALSRVPTGSPVERGIWTCVSNIRKGKQYDPVRPPTTRWFPGRECGLRHSRCRLGFAGAGNGCACRGRIVAHACRGLLRAL